jgi:hypothetical protein
MAQWIHACPFAVLEVNTKGVMIKVTEDGGVANKIKRVVMGNNYQRCSLKFRNNGSVVVHLLRAFRDDYARFTCHDPIFKIFLTHMIMNCSNLEGDIEFRYRWLKKPDVPPPQDAANQICQRTLSHI